jgi:inosine-uridine nucleoside N-ribohydrolase
VVLRYSDLVSRPTILLDCDPGHDDAIALLVAGVRTNLVGVSVVSGNVSLDRTTRNALITCQLLGIDVPVYPGATGPLAAEPRHAEFIHGRSGLDGPKLPVLRAKPAKKGAVQFIIEASNHYPDLWLVATGPLTNVALAMQRDSGLATRLSGIALMGGSSTFGNITSTAEFNISFDPEAADIVFRSGAKIIMAGLNLTHQFLINHDRIERIRNLGGPVALFVSDLLQFYVAAYAREYSGRLEGPLHDPTAVLALTNPELFEYKPKHAIIELCGEHTRGMTVIDARQTHQTLDPNIDLLTSIDNEGAFGVLCEAISTYGGVS